MSEDCIVFSNVNDTHLFSKGHNICFVSWLLSMLKNVKYIKDVQVDKMPKYI